MSHAPLGAFCEALPEAVVVVGPGERVLASNRVATAILPGLRVGEPLVRALRAPTVLSAVARVLGGGPATTVSWREQVPVEQMFDVHVRALEGVEGGQAAVLTLRDLTETRRLERMRVDFVANASHELRTPLASLLGFVETLQGAARDDPVAREKFLTIMGEQTRRMSRLVDDLLSLSRIEQTLHLRPVGRVDLASLARGIADTLRPLADEAEAAIRVEADQPILVVGDSDELFRVVENLVENAVKYGMPPGGAAHEVVISVSAKGGQGRFAVVDRGPGIAPHHLPRLTERFYRADPGESRAKGGTGLGLALVKHVLARHRGQLTIQSAPGVGSTFTVSVPLAPRVGPTGEGGLKTS